MKNLIASLLVGFTVVFPPALSQRSQAINARADKAIADMTPLVNDAASKGRHYVYFVLSPWDSAVANEVRYRLNKLDGVWTDNTAGPILVHFK